MSELESWKRPHFSGNGQMFKSVKEYVTITYLKQHENKMKLQSQLSRKRPRTEFRNMQTFENAYRRGTPQKNLASNKG